MDNNHKIIRQSLLEWYPFRNDDDVFLLNKKDSSLDELIARRANLIEADEYSSFVEALEDGKKYDVVIMYDLYDFCISNKQSVRDCLDKLLSIKKNNGTLLLALENKLGMKYFAGCQEEQRGGYYIGIEDYSKWDNTIQPLSKKELEDIIMEFKNVSCKFYYPYPDYKYPTMIYTDDCLPKEGELSRNTRNVDMDRYVMFDEARAFDSVIKAGLFPEFSNSYLICIE